MDLTVGGYLFKRQLQISMDFPGGGCLLKMQISTDSTVGGYLFKMQIFMDFSVGGYLLKIQISMDFRIFILEEDIRLWTLHGWIFTV